MFFLFLYIYIYVCVYIHSVAHLNMTTFVQEHLLYLIVYHDRKIDCNNTDMSVHDNRAWYNQMSISLDQYRVNNGQCYVTFCHYLSIDS